MKFDIQIPSLNGIARLEIKTLQEEQGWSAYLSLAADRSSGDICWVLGQSGIPHRFTGATERAVQEAAKKFLEENYEVVRMIW